MIMIKKYLLLIFPILIVGLYILRFSLLKSTLDTSYDEGYLFLKLQSTLQGNIEGKTQWTTLVKSIFGEKASSNLMLLRIIRFFTHLTTVFLFVIVSVLYLKKKNILRTFQQTLLFICIAFLVGLVNSDGIIIAYNQLQEFFLIGMLCCFLIALQSNLQSNLKVDLIMSFIIGGLSLLSILTILPSGVLISFFIISFILSKNFENKKNLLFHVISLVLGFIFSAILFHLFVADLLLVFDKMSETARIVTKLNRGYDPLSFFLAIVFYFRDYYFQIATLFGLCLIFFLIAKLSSKVLRNLLYVIYFVFVVYLQYHLGNKKIQLPYTTLLSFPLIAIFVLKLMDYKTIELKRIFNFNILFNLFLFFFPLIASIGTNLTLSFKMMFFLLPWSLLLYELKDSLSVNNGNFLKVKCLIVFFVLILVRPQIYAIYNTIRDKNALAYTFNKEKPISNFNIPKAKKEYYDKVYNIMKNYNFVNNDHILSTYYNNMTIVAFDAKPCGVFFAPDDFVLESQNTNFEQPDFMLLSDYDVKVMNSTLQQLDWNFPEAYDRYNVDKLPTQGISYEVALYCLKSRNIQKH